MRRLSTLLVHVPAPPRIKRFIHFSQSCVVAIDRTVSPQSLQRITWIYKLDSHNSNNSASLNDHNWNAKNCKRKKMAANDWIGQKKNILCLYNCNLLLMFSNCARAPLQRYERLITKLWIRKIDLRQLWRRRHTWFGRVCQIDIFIISFVQIEWIAGKFILWLPGVKCSASC